MQNIEIKLSDSFIETSADFASFSPVSSSNDKMIYIHFLKNKAIPVIVSQQEIQEERVEQTCKLAQGMNFTKNVLSLWVLTS